MIRSLTIIDPTKTHIGWWEKVEALKEPRTFTFKPGLNILWGKNGSGKSTVIKALARLLHCEQSGNPVLTQASLQVLYDRWFASDGYTVLKDALKISHDGQGVRYFDPSNTVGLYRGAAFDDDFFAEGLQNTMFRGSAGETTLFRFDRLLSEIIEGVVPEVEYRMKPNGVNSHWSPRVAFAMSLLKGSGKKGPPTVLLDEPSRSFDLGMQVKLWRIIRAYSDRVQFIVASHNLFALNLSEADYIELSPGYIDEAILCHDLLNRWPMTKCEPIDPKLIEKARKERAKQAKKKGQAAKRKR